MATLQEAIKYASENPETPFANELRKRIESGAFKNELSAMKSGLPQPPGAETIGQVGIGAIKGLGQTARAFGSIAPTAGAKLAELVTGKKQEVFEPISKEMVTAEGTAQKVGYGVEKIAEFLLPGKAITAGTTTVRTALTAAKLSPALVKWLTAGVGAGMEALSAGVVSKIQGATNKDARNSAILAGVISAPLKLLGEFKQPLAGALQRGAEKKATQALAPTTKEMKQLSDKIVPELLKRRTFFLTRGGLAGKATTKADDFGVKIGDAFDALPPETKIQITPIIHSLEKLKDSAVSIGAGGQRVIINEAKYKAAQELQNTFLDLASDPNKFVSYPNVAVDSIRRARQIMDAMTAKAGKGFGLGLKDTAKIEANKAGANAIRNELAQEFPVIDKLNKEFTFWKNVEKVVEATIERTKAQGSGLTTAIAESGGAVAGAVVKGTVGGVVLGGVILSALKKTIQSPAWRMTSAITRQTLADAIYRGNIQSAIQIMNRIIVGGTTPVPAGQTEVREQQ